MRITNMAAKRPDARNLILCVAATAAAMLVIWPFAELGYGDDTAYAHVALGLARTGSIVYNGWEAALLVTHACWGALFVRLLGFSFVSLRLSTTPFALGAVGLCYALVRRAGLQEKNALLVSLLFGLSPLFLPVAVSYMTDVPGLFFIFVSLYSFARAAESSSEWSGQGWLAFGALTGFLGGTSRQVVWLAPLTVLPYFAWAKPGHKRLWMTALLAWILVLAGAVHAVKWFNNQPYTVFQPSVFSEVKLAMSRPFGLTNMTARSGLMLLFVILPAAVPLTVRAAIDTWRGPRSRQILVGALLTLLFLAIVIHPSLASIPWVSSTLNWQGINGDAPLPGRPIVLTWPIRALAALAAYVTTCILASELLNIRPVLRRAWGALADRSGRQFTLVGMSLFSIAYFALLVIRSAGFDIFDRYLLPLIPWAATLLLLWFESDNPDSEHMLRRAMPFSWVLLVILAFYAVASTQDLWALAEARVLAARKLESAGVSRIAIDGKFEYNAWTQLMITGRMNSRWVVNPPDAYNPNESQTPVVVPVYRLEYAPVANETTATEFGSVPYYSIFPPFRKQVRIDRILAPSPSNR